MIRPDLRDLINRHKPTERLNINNNNNYNNYNNNNNNNNNNNDTDRGEWKIMLRMYIRCISTKSFIETCTMHPKSKQVEFYMGSDTENVIDTLFNTLLQNFQLTQETSNERGSEFTPDSVELLEYELHKINIIRAESYIESPDWLASKKPAINPKNENYNKYFHWAIVAELNYNIIKEKELKKLIKFKKVDIDLSADQRYWENFEQENNLIAINILFVSHNSEKIKLTYKSSYNKRGNQVLLLMINDEDNGYYYFAIKNLSELNSLGRLKGKKEALINNNDNNNFQNVFNDALNYQFIDNSPQRISKLKPYVNVYKWEGINVPVGSKKKKKFGKNNDTITFNILYVE